MKAGKRFTAMLLTFILLFTNVLPAMAGDDELPETVVTDEAGDEESGEASDNDIVPPEEEGEDANPNEVTEFEDISEEVLAKLMAEAKAIDAATAPDGNGMSRKADVVFVIDTTGSMGDEIAAVKENLSAFVNYLADKGLTLRFGIVSYRDTKSDGINSTIIHRDSLSGSPWYTSAARTIEELSSLTVGGGGDTPEMPIDALGYLCDDNTYNWSSNATRCAILLTDADYHVTNRWGYPRAIASPTDSDRYTAMTELAEELFKRNIVTSVITSPMYYPDYEMLVRITGGILGDITGDFFIVLQEMADTILNAAAKTSVGVYILPGYMGSQLYSNEDNSLVWADPVKLVSDATAYLTGSDPGALARDLGGEGARVHPDAEQDIYGTLDQYRPLVEFLSANLDENTHTIRFFPYDWLGDLDDAQALLAADIKASGYDKVILVGHSTGGLVASAFIADSELNRAKVDKAVLVAAPLYGTYTAAEALTIGKSTTFDSMLSAIASSTAATVNISALHSWVRAVVANSPASYQLLPSEEYLRMLPQMNKGEKNAPITSAAEYYAYLSSAAGLNAALLSGSANSHSYFRNTGLYGDVAGVLNMVDTTLIGNSEGKATPAIGVLQTGLFAGAAFTETVYKAEGDSTVMGVSALLKPAYGGEADSIKRVDLRNSANAKNLDHGGLVTQPEGLSAILAAIKDDGSSMASYSTEIEWAEDEVYAVDAAADEGMADTVKFLVNCRQELNFTVTDKSGTVVAMAGPTGVAGFGQLDRFTYDVIPASDGSVVYQIQVPKTGYVVTITASAPGSSVSANLAAATLDRGGFRKVTALYEIKSAMARIDMTAGVDDESIKTLADQSGSGLTYRNEKKGVSDWTIKEDKVILNEIGESHTLTLTGDDADKIDPASLNWTSTDSSVVSVAGGVVTAEGYGDAYIYANTTDGSGKSGSCHVIVGVYPTAVYIEDFSMIVGKSIRPKAVFTPSNTNITGMSFSSSNQSVVKVINRNTLKAVGEGIAEITGRTENNIATTFFVTVRNTDSLYVDEVSIDPGVAVLGKDQSSTVVARIVPETAFNKKVTWNIADESVATFTLNADNSCTIVGHAEGVTQLSAISDDGSYNDDATIVVGNILNVDATRQMIMKPGEQKQLVLEKDGVYYPVSSTSSTAATVAKASATGMVTASGRGNALITLEGARNGKKVSTVLQVRVVDSASDVISSVRVTSDKVKSNVYYNESGEVMISIAFAGDGTSSYDVSLDNIAMMVDSAEFADAATASVFALAPTGDSSLKIIPRCELTDSAIKALQKSYSSAVKVTIDGTVYTTKESVTVNVDTTVPSVKAANVTLNAFFKNDSAPLEFTSECGEITSVSVSEKASMPSGIVLDGMSLRLDGSTTSFPKAGVTATLSAKSDRLRKGVDVKVNVKVLNSQPAFRFSSSTVKVFGDVSKNRGQLVYLQTKSKSESLSDYPLAGIGLVAPDEMTDAEKKKHTINDKYTVYGFDPEEGSFMLKPLGSRAAGGSLLLQVNMYDSSEVIRLPLKVSVVSKAKIKTSKSSIKFSSKFTSSEVATVEFSVNPADYDISGFKVKAVTTKGNQETSDISVTLTGNRITIRPNTTSKKGKYRVRLYDGSLEKIISVTLNSKKAKGKLKASGEIDLAKPATSHVTLDTKLKGFTYDKNYLSCKISSAYRKVPAKYGYRTVSVYDSLTLTNLGNGKARLTLNPSGYAFQNGNVQPGKYTIKVGFYISGRLVTTASASFKIKCGKFSMSANTDEVVLTAANTSVPVPVTVEVSGPDASMLSWKCSGGAMDFAEVEQLSPGKFAIKLDSAFAGSGKSGNLVIEGSLPGGSSAKVSVNVVAK
ncbi:MAG: Ig-like domain-containing protein [Lachnospiraceae bacterium]|nr:Ig-like domain-containing protein [Lachnospiraceae bacterium]